MTDLELNWPTKPTCHKNDYRLTHTYDEREYRQVAIRSIAEMKQGYGHNLYPTCDFCGSVSPQALYEAWQRTDAPVTRCSWADFKYGWPHKLYLDLPLPAGEEFKDLQKVITSSHRPDGSGKTISEYTFGPVEMVWSKFYTLHVLDITDEPTRDVFIQELEKRTAVHFSVNEQGDLFWRSTRNQ